MDPFYALIGVRCGNTVMIVVYSSRMLLDDISFRVKYHKLKKCQKGRRRTVRGSFHFQFTAFSEM